MPKRVGMAILIADKIDLKKKKTTYNKKKKQQPITRDRQVTDKKGPIHQENIKSINICAPNITEPR